MIQANIISNYRVDKFCYGNQANLRSFELNGGKMQLSVDTKTLRTSIHSPVKTIGSSCDGLTYQLKPYFKLLKKSASAPYPLQNDGMKYTKRGVTLTTDLCPSSKSGFEGRLYKGVINNFQNPVPITLFITGRWIVKHRASFEQFKRWQNEGKLDITWGNHTYKHTYYPKRPLEHNFVLSSGYKLKNDALNLEKILITNGVTPSVFFRFPGLVSDHKSIDIIRKLGLIVIGSNTWIAKGQRNKNGSIILVHGNKNEPRGVTMLLGDMKKKKIKKLTPLNKALK